MSISKRALVAASAAVLIGLSTASVTRMDVYKSLLACRVSRNVIR